MNIQKKFLVILIACVFILSQGLSSFAADMGEETTVKDLMKRIQDLESKVDGLNKKLQRYEEKPAMTVSEELIEKKMKAMMMEKEKAPTIIGMPEISGYIDTTYNYNFNNPPSQTTVFAAPGTNVQALGGTNLSAYVTRENDIVLNSAHLAFNGTLLDEVSYTIEIDAGRDANITASGGAGAADNFDIQEAYLTVPLFNTGVTVKAGKFVTLEGIEVIESPLNPTISRGYLYGFAEPFTHVGFLASMPLPDPMSMFELRAGLVNGWDLLTDNNEGKTFIGGIGFDFGDVASGGFSMTYGPEQAGNNDDNRLSLDLTVFTKPFPEYMPNLTVALQGNWGNEHGLTVGDDENVTDDWYGFGVQPIYQVTDKFSVAGRIEYMYNDKGSRFGGNNAYMTNFTVTPAYKITDNVTARLEYRYDVASKALFETGSGIADNEDVGQILAEVFLTF